MGTLSQLKWTKGTYNPSLQPFKKSDQIIDYPI